MAVEGIVGLMGAGKTLLATQMALRARASGARVIANYRIAGCEYAESWDDVLDATMAFSKDTSADRQRVLLIIDELNLWAPSRLWQKLDPRLLYFWAQGRKMGLDMIWTSQHESRVDSAVREITYRVWKSRRYGPVFRPLLFQYAAYLPAELRTEKRVCIGRRWILPRKSLLTSYNTCEVIDLQATAFAGKAGEETYRESRELQQVGSVEVTVPGRQRRGLVGRKRQKGAVVRVG